MTRISLLAGPDPSAGMEHHRSHVERLGALPGGGVVDIIGSIARSGLRGRGGAAFPVATKWQTVAQLGGGDAVVLANGLEGEPFSRKDRLLLELRPHLVIDGALLAASAIGARDIVLYLGAEHTRAVDAVRRALAERSAGEWRRIRVVTAPVRYVSGEESAAVRFVNSGVALPASTPPRPYQRGVDGRPTLVQNVESVDHVAMIARFGDTWFCSLGRGQASGTALLTVAGAVRSAGVVEVAQGSSLGDAVAAAGGLASAASAVLVGGYFGQWVNPDDAWGLSIDAEKMRAQGSTLGCGVIAVLPERRCGVVETAHIAAYLAGQSARQCGPCVFGLRAIAEACNRVASCTSSADDLDRIGRWRGELPGRGACHHPDGAASMLASSLRVFATEFALHHDGRSCSAVRATAAEAA